MKILHTSDWHLGRSLYGRKRYDEFEQFLDWLTLTLDRERIDALLIAGDVFDTGTPGNRAQELYYRFLCRVSASCCRHVVVIAGNHDSPSFLNAPKDLLRALDVYVVGAMTEALDDEVIVLHKDGKPEAIICAVPYLRDKDLRTVEPGETMDDKNIKLALGLKKHYSDVCAIAEKKRDEILQSTKSNDQEPTIPIIAMGHLFTAGGKTVDGDGVRELYVGSLIHVGPDSFPRAIDYLALGHLHVPQRVGGNELMRYSGSPIPMGFGEAKQQKHVVIIEFGPEPPGITRVPVPCFQPLIPISGSLDDIHSKLGVLKKNESRAWLEIEYTGQDIVGNLREVIDEMLTDSFMEILRIKNRRVTDQVINVMDEETLDDLSVHDVFTRCLDAFNVSDEDKNDLTAAYNAIVAEILEEDSHEE